MITTILDITAVLLGILAAIVWLMLLVALVFGFLGYLRDRKKAK